MNRKALVCVGIVIALLLGLFGQQALALCVSDDHLAVEVMGHPPCGPTSPSHGQAITSGSPCYDILVGSVMEASLQGKRDTAHVAQALTGGGFAHQLTAPLPTLEWRRTPWRAVAVDLDPRLHSLRTVVLLI